MGADQTHDWQALAGSALEWWRDAGVDVLVQDSPRDWLAAAVAAPVAIEIKVAVPALPDTLEAFVAWRAGPDTPDAGSAGPRFVAEGDAASGLMVVVDCPDAVDPDGGGIISGAAGRLLDQMLAAIGRDRASIYLVPLIAARPIAGRIPPETEAALAPLLRRHVALAAPKRLLVLGQAASRALLAADGGVGRGRLQPVNLDGFTVDAVAGFPPSVLLERPAAKAESWRGLQALIEGLS